CKLNEKPIEEYPKETALNNEPGESRYRSLQTRFGKSPCTRMKLKIDALNRFLMVGAVVFCTLDASSFVSS
ncbi:hypothetical protein, partial [Helicobacter pylori]|uniref:hypothetical protein n=1 Tax=Helicobacter pylori TaxID=210 RepID=UPI000534ACDE